MGAAEIFGKRIIDHTDQSMDLQQLATGGPTVPMGLFGAVICTAGIIQGGHQLFQFRDSLWADRKENSSESSSGQKSCQKSMSATSEMPRRSLNGVFAHMVELAAVDQIRSWFCTV
ncbi:MAG: hypothetical protein ACLVH0_04445 [Coprococcus eutactus]